MAELNQFQQLSWVIYNNLVDEIANPANSIGDISNHRELLQGFLRNESFEFAVLEAAQEYDPSQLPAITRNVTTAYQAPETALGSQANYLVDDIAQGNLESLASLIDGYDPSAGYAAQIAAIELNEFGVRAFDDAVEAIDSDAYYYIVADPRYAEIQGRYEELTGVRINIDADIAEATQFVSDYPDPELAAEAEAFYAAYLASPDAYMSEAPNIDGEDLSAPDTPEIEDITSVGLVASFQGPAALGAPEVMAAPVIDVVANTNAVPTVTEEEIAATRTDFVWNDNTIFETYEALRTANPDTIAGMSDVTQEAFSVVQEAVAFDVEFAQYNLNPAAYIANGNIPPSEDARMEAENAAYDHLAALDLVDAQTVATEAVAVVEFDAEQDITPPTPEALGGQAYLADAGLNENGTAFLADEAETELAAEDEAMSVPVVPRDTFEWDDNAITSTYEDLLAANSESIGSASEATQEAYSYVAEARTIEVELAQYNTDPSAYIRNGNIPPTYEALEAAENAAYDHLAGLDLETAEIVATEAAEIVASDAEREITPLTPEQEGGQQYLADAGLNEDGTAYIEEETFERPAEPDAVSPEVISPAFNGSIASAPEVDSVYQINAGDNLWNIARTQYELTDAADIMRAVDHIARMNGLENGADANHIQPYDPNRPEEDQLGVGALRMPSAEQITSDIESLDWSALDRDVAAHRSGGHYAHTGQVAAAPIIN